MCTASYFDDFQRVFDCVKHSILIETLRDIGLDDRDIRVVVNLYRNQTARVSVERIESTLGE